MDIRQGTQWLQRYADIIRDKKAFLTELDSAIGDGDHGANMARGWKEVKQALEGFEGDFSALFLLVSRTLIAKVGGAAGPLYGTAFLRMGMYLKGKQNIDGKDWPHLIRSGADGIAQRGKVSGGEKTMYDVWAPVAERARVVAGEEESERAAALAELARERAEATREMKASKGRASYLGDRSIGHVDPGAESSALLFESLRDTLAPRGGD